MIFGTFQPVGASREAAMLRNGGLTVTVTSKATGGHVTMRLRCAARVADGADGARWPTCSFAEASHVFIDAFDGVSLAVYQPRKGVLTFDRTASDAAVWSVKAVLRWCAGDFLGLSRVAELVGVGFCRTCGRELTDPESVERGYGPECYGEATRSLSIPVRA